jgi:hypothetical protein
LLEGAFWGACGGGTAALFLWLADRVVVRHLDLGAVLGVAASVRLFAPELGIGILATGILLGVSGAVLAVRRFLDLEPA